jgi:hypothetical protein
MKRKPIRIDWTDLEAAFENPNVDLVYYLDMVTGRVFLEGEGEGEEEEDDESDLTRMASRTELPGADSSRAAIRPVDTPTRVKWMKRFVSEVEGLDEEILDKLKSALESDDPAPQLILVLRQYPECQEQWYVYRADRVRERIDAWLEELNVRAVDPPPWDG